MKNERIIVNYIETEEGRSFTLISDDFLDNEILTCEEKMVYIVLQAFRDDQKNADGTISAPIEQIAKCAGMSTNRAKRTIDRLIEHGFATRQRPGTGKTNIYTIIDKTKGRANNEE